MSLISEHLVFKDYDRDIRNDLVQCEIALAHSFATATMAEILANTLGDSVGQQRTSELLKRMPRYTQIAKHVIAPWLCKAPSDEKDGQNTDGVVDWYHNLKASIDVIKKKRREAREREANMSKAEQEDNTLDKLIQASEYRTG